MKIDRIAYEQLYPTGVYANQRYRVEIQLEKGDTCEDAFREAKVIVENVFTQLNPQINWNEVPQSPTQQVTLTDKTPTKDERIQSFIATINMCTSLKFLENFKKRVDNEANHELSSAYANKYDQLFQIEIQKIQP